MKIIKIIIIVIPILLLLSASMLFGIPIGSKKGTTDVIGKRQNGSEIMTEQIYYFRIHPLSPEGAFYRSTWDYTYYYEQTRQRKNKLDFFTDKTHHYELLKPVFPITNTDQWVAFRLSSVEREKVNLLMYVFNSKKILHTFEIKNAIRTSTCAWKNADSYSISQSNTDGIVTINTLDGLVTYDQASNSLMNDSNAHAK